jgi:hypothetical protein
MAHGRTPIPMPTTLPNESGRRREVSRLRHAGVTGRRDDVDMDDPGKSSLVIIRTWREDGSDRSFRAQIRVAMDVSSGSSSTVHVADPDAVLEAVRAFLQGEGPEPD